MKEILVEAKSLPEAYHASLKALAENGEHTPCPDYNTNQKECSMTIVVNEPLSEPMISRLFIGGFKELEQYRREMLDGILDFEIERGNWEYTYHDRMAHYNSRDGYKDQIQFVIDDLKRNPSSRRAVIDIRDNAHDLGSDDPACLQHIQFFIRNDALHCKVLFRSNDACKATYMNAFALIMLQKRVADALGVPVGTYTHRANSFHCYERDYGMLDGYVKRIQTSELDDVTYEYEDVWKPMMEAVDGEIDAMVEELKNR